MRRQLRMRLAVIVAAGLPAAETQRRPRLLPERLRVDYQREPLGVDAAAPLRFSWALRAEPASSRGLDQGGYRLLVEAAPSGEVLLDTGRVRSARPVAEALALPASAQLQCGATSFRWSVEVWAAEGMPASSGAANSTFGAAPSAGCWRDPEAGARWIGGARLRKDFRLSAAPSAARVHIACPGYCRVTANGALLSQPLGHQTLYERSVLVDTHDATPALRAGANTIGVEVGNGWYGR